ncbi:MAG: DUF58 domain-containing protein [Zestosphaera sp.]
MSLVGYVSGLVRSFGRLNAVDFEHPDYVRTVVGEEVCILLNLSAQHLELVRITRVEVLCDVGLNVTGYDIDRNLSGLRLSLYARPRVGTHRISGLRLYFRLLGGLADGFITLDADVEVRAIPSFKTAHLPYVSAGLKHVGAGPSRTRGGGTNILEIREYVPGDEFRRIDWKATARLSRLAVKEFEKEMRKDVLVTLVLSDRFFDPGSRALEYLVNDVCRLVSGLLHNSLHVRLLVVTERGFVLSDKVVTTLKIGNLLEALSRVEWPEEPLLTYSALRVASWLLLPVVTNSCTTPCMVVNIVSFEDLSDVEAAQRIWRGLKTLSHEVFFAVTSPSLTILRHEEVGLEDLSRAYRELEVLTRLSRLVPNCIVAPDLPSVLIEKVLRLRMSF